MPALNFLNRNNNKSNDGSEENPNSKASTMNAALLHLPPEECRRVVRDRVMAAAAAVNIRHQVDASMALDEDPDLSKDAKAKKREAQYASHEACKDRLHQVLGNESFSPLISTCLVLDPTKTAGEKSSSTNNPTLSLHAAFACVTLLLCNLVLLVATTSSSGSNQNLQDSSGSCLAGGYDARIRNVLCMASIELLAEKLEQDDKDGSLLKRLKDKQQSRQRVQLIDDGDNDASADGILKEGENIESQLSHFLEEELHKKQDTAKDDAPNTTAEVVAPVENLEDVDSNNSKVFDDLYRRYATRKYQALEQAVTDLMMNQMVNNAASSEKIQGDATEADGEEEANNSGRFSRKNLVRAAKIGGVGVVAGTLFAVTGGLAAPGIAAGVAALGVGSTVLTLATPAALIALFGVGGGGLSAYKMKRRTDGLTEFSIHQETTDAVSDDTSKNATAHLHTTVCIAGWLNDENDFQRPWGVTPSNLSYLERLQRFFSVVDPEKVHDAKEMAKPYSKNSNREEGAAKDEELWLAFSAALKAQYGKTPDNLLPLEDRATTLSEEEDETLREIFDAIVHTNTSSDQPSNNGSRIHSATSIVLSKEPSNISESIRLSNSDKKTSSSPVWDYQTEYGGDLYTIKWESAMLLNMCQVANNMVKQAANKATTEVLKKTALATIMAAVAWPSLLMGLAGSLDNDWTLITIRSDLAGIELARSLLQSDERRPVNLVGFSFGARVVYACLLELERHQAIWEAQQHQQDKKNGTLKNRWKKKTAEDSIEYTREPASIVQDALLIGAPLFVSRSKLRLARHMVAGRFINCYSRKDWILSLMFQYQNTSGIMRGTCGTGPVKGVGGIENYDVSSLVSSWHANYCKTIPDILDMIGFDQPMPSDTKSQ